MHTAKDTLTVRWGRGYRGALGNRPWVARICGTDPRYGLERKFLEPEFVRRERFDRERTIVEFSYRLAPDTLYEVSEAGDRRFILTAAEDGGLTVKEIDTQSAHAFALALATGKPAAEARQAALSA